MPLHTSVAPVSAKPTGHPARAQVLIVDDDDAVRATTAKLVHASGYEVSVAASGIEALAVLDGREFEVVITDISMPGMDGIRLLREIRTRDPYVQVILMTGVPSIETAISAVEYGAVRYLMKPVTLQGLRDVVQRSACMARLARAESQAARLVGHGHLQATDALGLSLGFERALEKLWVAYQPIVRASDGTVAGYEALVRSDEAMMPTPNVLLEAGERLGRIIDLGRRVRDCLPSHPVTDGSLLFVNLHPEDLLDPLLASPSGPLLGIAPSVVLEITERAALHRVPDVTRRVAALRDAGFRIAVDDLGAGYSGLSTFTHLEPEFVKLDLSLVRGIDRNPTQLRVVGAITRLAKELGMTVVAEGVETIPESEALRELGCDLLQGFLFASPGRAFPTSFWPHAG
jgi:EAL domain-containing protein (putative c-di-GMP-specific phosphodiesterase class I)